MKLDELKKGDVIQVDGNFDCMSAGEATVREDEHGLYLPCTHGRHYIDGQQDDIGDLVGLSKPE